MLRSADSHQDAGDKIWRCLGGMKRHKHSEREGESRPTSDWIIVNRLSASRPSWLCKSFILKAVVWHLVCGWRQYVCVCVCLKTNCFTLPDNTELVHSEKTDFVLDSSAALWLKQHQVVWWYYSAVVLSEWTGCWLIQITACFAKWMNSAGKTPAERFTITFS